MKYLNSIARSKLSYILSEANSFAFNEDVRGSLLLQHLHRTIRKEHILIYLIYNNLIQNARYIELCLINVGNILMSSTYLKLVTILRHICTDKNYVRKLS